MEKGTPDSGSDKAPRTLPTLSAAMTLKMERVNSLFREGMSKNYLENGPKARFEKAARARDKADREAQAEALALAKAQIEALAAAQTAEEEENEEEIDDGSEAPDVPTDEVVESVIEGAAIEQQAIVDTETSEQIQTMSNQVKEEMQQQVSVHDIEPQSLTDLPQ